MTVSLEGTAATWTAPCEPKVLTRYGEGGTPRSVAISLPGTPIVTEYVQTQMRRKLVLRWEAVSAESLDDLRTILDSSGPLTLTYNGGSQVTVVPGAQDEHSFENVFRDDLPYGAPERLWYWRVQLTLYILDDPNWG